jgi:hypothetical protein
VKFDVDGGRGHRHTRSARTPSRARPCSCPRPRPTAPEDDGWLLDDHDPARRQRVAAARAGRHGRGGRAGRGRHPARAACPRASTGRGSPTEELS